MSSSSSCRPPAPAASPPTPAPGRRRGAEYLLTLENHHGGTVYFSDRPERIVGDAPTQQFLHGLGFSPTNPPNAALVTQTENGEEEVVVLELLNPSYDESSSTLTYGATILEEYQGEGLQQVAAQQQDAELPESFGRASLFIDDCPNINYCSVFDGQFLEQVANIPGGPYGSCWHWSNLSCEPCSESQSSLDDLCNSEVPACNGECVASA